MSSREINYDPARIRFELAGPDNDKELLEILCEVFQRQFTRAWHEWFAYGSPHGQTRYYLARDLHSGQIVATYGLMPLKVKLGNAIVKGALSVNTGARMIWRGTGLFQELGRYALRTDGQTLGTVISLGVPNRSRIMPCNESAGSMSAISSISPAVRCRSRRQMLSKSICSHPKSIK